VGLEICLGGVRERVKKTTKYPEARKDRKTKGEEAAQVRSDPTWTKSRRSGTEKKEERKEPRSICSLIEDRPATDSRVVPRGLKERG